MTKTEQDALVKVCVNYPVTDIMFSPAERNSLIELRRMRLVYWKGPQKAREHMSSGEASGGWCPTDEGVEAAVGFNMIELAVIPAKNKWPKRKINEQP